MSDEITTQRLRLSPLGQRDLENLHALWTEERFRHYLWDGEVVPRAQTQSILERNESQFDEFGYSIWGLRQSRADTLVGIAGFWEFHTPPMLELLFGVAPAHWGRGLATEAASAVMRHGYDKLGFTAVLGSSDADNLASIRVMEKLGLVFHRRETLEGLDTVFYGATKRNWLPVSGGVAPTPPLLGSHP